MKLASAIILCAVSANACRASSTGDKASGVESVSAKPQKLSLNDVSIMFPISYSADFAEQALAGFDTPKANVAGVPIDEKAAGRFLAADMVGQLGKQIGQANRFSMTDQSSNFPTSYRLVAMRIDPCFNIRTAKANDGLCQQQMRLVWQPISVGHFKDWQNHPKTQIFTDDNAVHAVYNLSRAEFQDVLDKLTAEKAKADFNYDDQPLGPNPLLIKQGVNGSYYKTLRSIVNQYASRSRLIGMTGLDGNDSSGWNFTGLISLKGTPTPADLIGVDFSSGGSRTALHFREVGFTSEIHQTTPAVNGPDQFMEFDGIPLWNGHSDFDPDHLKAQDVARIHAAEVMTKHLPLVYRVLDPAVHDITNTDCASCHQAGNALQKAVDKGIIPADGSTAFKSHWNTTNLVSGTNGVMLHMFSFTQHLGPNNDDPFVGAMPIVSPRVITESAIVADYINDHWLK